MDDVDDPYFDPDDPASDHLLFDGAPLSVLPDAPEFARRGEIPEQRAARPPGPDRSDVAADEEREAERARARSAARRDGGSARVGEGGADEGVRRVRGPVPEEHPRQPRGRRDHPRPADPVELENVTLYLAGKGKGSRPRNRTLTVDTRPGKFTDAQFIFEMGTIKILSNGCAQVTLTVPYDAVADALRLRTSYGILLEAKVAPVKRKAP